MRSSLYLSRRSLSQRALRAMGVVTFASSGAACAGMTGMGMASLRGAVAPDIVSGDWDEILQAEHRAVDQMFVEMMAPSATAARRADLSAMVKDALSQHALREENAVYPALRRFGVEQEARELFVEHADMKTTLAVITTQPPTDPQWMEAANALVTGVRGHVMEEEMEIFPAFKARLSADDNAMLTELVRMEAAKYTG